MRRGTVKGQRLLHFPACLFWLNEIGIEYGEEKGIDIAGQTTS